MSNRVQIFDTTLRDGEQSPGASMNVSEKIRMAEQLAKLRVDVIEAGFPASSEGDEEAVDAIARRVRGPVVAALARTNEQDIEAAFRAVRMAERPRIHTFISTSRLHMEHKLKMPPATVLEHIKRAVRQAKSYVNDVEFSCEDATRSDRNFLVEAVQTAVNAGATVVNIPDTVGYITPTEYMDIIADVRKRVSGIDNVVISVHCHDDLGMAVANSVMAVKAGARQVECTINGIGERAGNAALEEVVMAIRTRGDVLPYDCGIDTTQIVASSRLLAEITGMAVQANKAVVGANAFAHESGIHQDGMLKRRDTYEIMDPAAVGCAGSELVIGKHSGRAALKEKLTQMGMRVGAQELDRAFRALKRMADEKKVIGEAELRGLVS